MNLIILLFISILVLNLALDTVADKGPYGPLDCKPGETEKTPAFAHCQDMEKETTQKYTNSTEQNMDVYCNGLLEATKCFVSAFVKGCDIYAAREYMKEHLPKNDLNMTGTVCVSLTKYLEEFGVNKECDEKFKNRPDLVECKEQIEDALGSALAQHDAFNQSSLSTLFCNYSLSGLECLHKGYSEICNPKLVLAHMKDYAKYPDQVDMNDPECQKLHSFMTLKGVHPTQVPDPSASSPTVPDETEAPTSPSHAADSSIASSSTTSAAGSSTTSAPDSPTTSNHTSTDTPNNTSSSPMPHNPGNLTSQKPGHTDDTTEHNGAALAEIFLLEKFMVAVITALFSYATAKH